MTLREEPPRRILLTPPPEDFLEGKAWRITETIVLDQGEILSKSRKVKTGLICEVKTQRSRGGGGSRPQDSKAL